MALRVTGIPRSKALSAAELAAKAATHLAAADLAAYRNLFAQANTLEDPQRRYQAHKLLLEEGFTAAGRASAATAAQVFSAMASCAIELLETEPREPILLNYAGVALYELWSLDAAKALFKAALRLDPGLPHVRRNLDELAKRTRLRSRVPLRPELPALARRAKRVAAGAQPATGLTLSLCMIVRDEEEMLPRCLAAIAPAVDEIVIVDTGSTDRTVEIARSFGANVIEREWTGSFSDARNVSFEAATSDWIMYLDADEVLIADDVEKLRGLIGRTWREAFYLVETNFTGETGDGTALTHNALRIFRNRPHYRFEGRLHEQIAQHLPAYVPERIEQSTVRIEHYGYLGSVRDAKSKSERNITLLKAQMAESPATPFLHFNLGSEYAALGDARAALREFERAWAMITDDVYEFTPTLTVRLVKALRAVGRNQDAIARADDGLQRFPGYTDLVLEQASASVALGRRQEAIDYYRRCIEMGDAPARYTATVGCGTYLPRLALAELHLHAGEAEPALELLEVCVEQHPGFFGTVLPYASALLRTGMAPDEVTATVLARTSEPTPTVRFMLGTALYEAGAASQAEAQFRLVLERQPHSAQARVALGEALLSQRRYDQAAAEAAALPDDDPLAAAARRTQLFGAILASDTAGTQVGLERARAVGLPRHELDLFSNWAAVSTGTQPIRPLTAASTPLLGVILEALLRVQDFEAFEALLPLLQSSELPKREQHELLATIYLQRGFLASAAQEWMGVCNERPDVRALVGLGRVALIHGLPEDAVTFATEALSLDPSCTPARELITAAAA